MLSAASVLVCALGVLGRSEESMPPIELIATAPPGVSARAEAFVRRHTGTIYLITSSPAFLDAAASRSCDYSDAVRKLASILAHEEWHVRHGDDERGAYEAQLFTLIRLGTAPGSRMYEGVQRSMQAVLKAREQSRPAALMASSR